MSSSLMSASINIVFTAVSDKVANGNPALFDMTIRNDGTLDLSNVKVTNSVVLNCNRNIGTLAAGSQYTDRCESGNLTNDLSNKATVDALYGSTATLPIQDSDTATVTVVYPSVSISKTPATAQVISGRSATFNIEVENDGDVALTNVVVSNSPTAACSAAIGSLLVGETHAYSCSTGSVTSNFTDTATASGQFNASSEGVFNNTYRTAPSYQSASSSAYTVSDSASTSVGIVNPDVTIELSVANSVVLKNSSVTFTIKVINSGDVDLTNVQITDPEVPGCDKSFIAISAGGFEEYTCTANNVSSSFKNEAFVSASYLTETVNDSSSLDISVVEPEITIAVTADTPTVVIGDDANFTIRVENTGDTALNSVTITDAQVPSCNKTYSNLSAGASREYSCTAQDVSADFTNSATVTGQSNPGGYTVSDSDSAAVDTIDPSIKLVKLVIDSPIPDGGTGRFRIKVENTGDVTLTNVVITDPLVPECNKTYAALTAGQIRTHLCEKSGINNSFTNTANVTAKDALNNTYNSSDNVLLVVNKPAIEVTVKALPTSITVGEVANFDISVKNTGNVKLFDVDVVSPSAPSCNHNGLGDLNKNQTKSYTCSLSGLVADFTNVVNTSAVDSLGTTVNDSGSDTVSVLNPRVDISVTPVEQSVEQNSDAVFTVTVFNTGNVTLHNVEVVSDTVPSCSRNLPNIPVDDNFSYACSASNVQEDFVNNLTVNTQTFGVTASDSTVAIVDVEITKSVVIALSPTIQTVKKGGTATFEVTVFNNSTVTINNITVSSSAPGDNCSYTFSALPSGFSKAFPNCQLQNVQASLVNTFTVTAVPEGSSDTISDKDVAVVNVVNIDMTLTADKNSFEYPGGTVNFTAKFNNSGTTDIRLGALSGVLIRGSSNTTAPLLNNNCEEGYILSPSEQYTCSFQVDVSGSSGSYSVEIQVSATDTQSGITISTSDVSKITVNAPPITDLYLPTLFADYRASDEPNNTCSTAFPIALNTAYTFFPNDTTDIYTFNLPSTSNLTVSVTNFTPVRGQIALFYGTCSSSTFVANDGKDSTTKTLNLSSQPAGNYILLVITDGAFSTTQPYNLILSTP